MGGGACEGRKDRRSLKRTPIFITEGELLAIIEGARLVDLRREEHEKRSDYLGHSIFKSARDWIRARTLREREAKSAPLRSRASRARARPRERSERDGVRSAASNRERHQDLSRAQERQAKNAGKRYKRVRSKVSLRVREWKEKARYTIIKASKSLSPVRAVAIAPDWA